MILVYRYTNLFFSLLLCHIFVKCLSIIPNIFVDISIFLLNYLCVMHNRLTFIRNNDQLIGSSADRKSSENYRLAGGVLFTRKTAPEGTAFCEHSMIRYQILNLLSSYLDGPDFESLEEARNPVYPFDLKIIYIW